MAELVGLPILKKREKAVVYATIMERIAEEVSQANQVFGPEPDTDETQYILAAQGETERMAGIAAAARKQRPQRWWLGTR
jgi:hypothetical protein